ncbi:MAG: hypothetical protein WC683_01960 [bacterium]
MLAEAQRRLDAAVPHGTLGIGEVVEVCTRMGARVARGEVCAATPFGVTLREEGTVSHFYHGDFYLFLPEDPELPEEAPDLLVDAHPDVRVRARLRALGEQGDDAEAAGNTAEPVDAGAEAPAEEPTPDEQAAVADDTSSVDVNALPDDIKKAVVTVQRLDGDQMNYVLAQAGQALMSALRRSNVSEAQLHSLVQRSQNAIYKILTGKPARDWKKTAAEK